MRTGHSKRRNSMVLFSFLAPTPDQTFEIDRQVGKMNMFAPTLARKSSVGLRGAAGAGAGEEKKNEPKKFKVEDFLAARDYVGTSSPVNLLS